jgi:hypothetical protein
MFYNKIVRDLSALPDFIDYYEKELDEAKKECGIKGSLEKSLSQLPGITEHRFNQLQEVEAVLEYLNIQLRKVHKKHFKTYLENYPRALTSRDAEKYADSEDEVIDIQVLINEVALLRNKYLGVLKGIETKNWTLGHITRLKVAGLDDASI